MPLLAETISLAFTCALLTMLLSLSLSLGRGCRADRHHRHFGGAQFHAGHLAGARAHDAELHLPELVVSASERIFIPQHPGGFAKRIAVVTDDGSFMTIQGVDASSACGDHRVLYTADTLGGSSGSPVLATSDNAVVALHSCGVLSEPSVNSGTGIRGNISDLKSKGVVPKDALDDPTAEVPISGWTPGAMQAPTPAPASARAFSICIIFICQKSCESTVLGKCKWLNSVAK